MEFTRFLPKGSVNFRLGIRQALMGADYQEQDNSRLLEKSYSKSSRIDRTHFVTSLAAETEFQPGWQLSTELGFQKGYQFRYDDALVDYLAEKSYSLTYGARNLRRLIQKELEDPMAAKIIDAFEHPITQIGATAKDGAVQLYTL